MKPTIKSLLACAGACGALASAGAHAEGFYTELGYASIKVGSSSAGFSATVGDAALRVGYMFTKNFGAEVFGATGVTSGDVCCVGPSVPASIKIDSAYGAYLKGQFEVAPSFELFAKAGWVNATAKASALGISASTSDSSFSYAIGVQWLITRNWYAQADYASYYDKSGDTAKGPSVSVGYRF